MRIIVIALFVALTVSAALPSQTSVAVVNNRIRVNNSPARLVFYGAEGMLAESAFDYDAFFQRCQARGINGVRVWAVHHWSNSLTPFSGTRAAGYDVTVLNPAFFDRLAGLVDSANRHGVVVHLTLFDAVAFSQSSPLRWDNCPYNAQRNVNGFITSPARFDDVGSSKWTSSDIRLIDASVARLRAYPNVIYELMNEPSIHTSDQTQRAFMQASLNRLFAAFDAQGSASRLVSVNIPPVSEDQDGTRGWALTEEARIKLVSVHLPEGAAPSSVAALVAGITKPVIVSTDGHRSQRRSNYGGSATARRDAVVALRNATFANVLVGRRHFDCLDKDLYGATWLTPNYDARYSRRDEVLMSGLGQ